MKSKTIILSSENEKGRGILTLFEEDDLLKCRLRLYNTPSLTKFCKIGVYHNKEVFSANLLEKNGVYTSSMVGDFDIDKDFYTAIVDTEHNNNVILSGGTYAGFFFNDQSVFEKEFPQKDETENIIKPEQNIENLTNTLNETENNPCEDCDKCSKCKYKEYFYSMQTIDEVDDTEQIEFANNLETLNCENEVDKPTSTISAEETNQNNQTKEQRKSIIQSIIPQFKYVFENYEQDEILNSLIPNSKFVKISENQEEYSIGAIYKEDEMKYICYAVMCNYNTPAPQELGPHYQWLPLDKEDPLSEGYYIVFQDAQDLKIVEL